MVRCLRGRKDLFAKQAYLETGTQGSNPCLTAKKKIVFVGVYNFTVIFAPAKGLSGCSVARLSRRVWDAEVAGSNPATPTKEMLASPLLIEKSQNNLTNDAYPDSYRDG